ncbi:MAG: TonB-dependent receptor [Nostoc sp.]|uniref:TonB-dependent siderophore receptor n=1 Tax=Nostoc sp. TaxID=1180 RepID=UPI002FF73969
MTDLLRSTSRDPVSDLDTEQTDSTFSPRAGIVYQPIKPISLYFSYATSFNSATGFSASGETFKPERSEQFEVGIKADLSQRLSATLAAYQIRKENVLVIDPNNLDFSIQTGEQKSRGMEFNLVGRPVNGWNIIASYAYTDAFVSKDTNLELVNDRLTAIPRHQFGLLNTYEIQQGSLKGLGFNLGFYYVSGDRETTLPNADVQLPSYFHVDTGVFYKRDNWKVQLNVNNLTNINYYNSNGYFVVPQPPLTVLGQVSVEF